MTKTTTTNKEIKEKVISSTELADFSFINDTNYFDSLFKNNRAQTFLNSFYKPEGNNCQKVLIDKLPEFIEIPDGVSQRIFQLLIDKPLFYDKANFKNVLLSIYQSLEERSETFKQVSNVYIPRNTQFYIIFEPSLSFKIFATPSTYFSYYLKSLSSRTKYSRTTKSVPVYNEETQTFEHKVKEGVLINPDIFFDFMKKVPVQTDTENLSESFLFFAYISNLAMYLLQKGCIIPDVVMNNDDKTFYIRYLPYIYNDAFKTFYKSVEEMFPNYCILDEKGNIGCKQHAKDLLSLFITKYFYDFKPLDAKKTKTKLVKTFISPITYQMDPETDYNLQYDLILWLNTLNLRNYDLSPVIRFELTPKDTFSLFIDVADNNNPLEPVTNLSDIFDCDGLVFGLSRDVVISSVLEQILPLASYLEDIRRVFESEGNHIPEYDLNDISNFIFITASYLRALGVKIVLPDKLKSLPAPKLKVKASLKTTAQNVSYLSLNEIVDFSYKIAVGNQEIPIEEFQKLVNSASGIIKYKDQFIVLEPDKAKNLLDKFNTEVKKPDSHLKLIHATLSKTIEGIDFDPEEAIEKVIADITKPEEIEIPEKLQKILRPYQERGVKWLYSNTSKGFGSCIADDMGLGKTLQVLTLLTKLKELKKINKPALVVCPTTLVGNWYKECEKFTPELTKELYYGPQRKLPDNGLDLVITSYGILRKDIDEITKLDWSLAIIDEAQNIKNPNTEQSRAVKALKADNYIAMTGTPVENRLSELWSIFDFINKGYFPNLGRFHRMYSVPIERHRDEEKVVQLKSATSPFILRRLKSDKSIIEDLPEKIISNDYCHLTKEQAALYQNTLNNTFSVIDKSGGIQRKGMIFKLITSLKQICNHPAHFTKASTYSSELSGKSEATVNLLEQILEKNEKALIFTQYKEMGDLLTRIIYNELNHQPYFFHGSLSRKNRDIMVQDFQEKDESNIMIVSLKAGGLGLNLTRATNVIHYDLWWNPAVENQATDRTYRIGQTSNVFIHRLITLGTFEEKIDEIIQAKQELYDLTISTGENWITEYSNDELKEIFSLRHFSE